jgi:hypothetical protein
MMNPVNPMEDLIELMEEIGIPFAYDHFAEGESPDPPFITFLLPGSDNFAADGKVYLKIDEVHIELYTDEKNPETEALVEDVLDAHAIFYDKTEVWIESEKLYEVLYSFEREVKSYAYEEKQG